MDFDRSEDHEAFRKVVRDFAKHEIAPHAEHWDRDHVFPVHVVRAMGQVGLFGLPFAERYGGSDSDFTTVCVAIGLRHRGTARRAVAGPLRRAQPRRVRSDGARCRDRRRRHTNPGPARRRRVADRRAKAFITNSGTPMTSLVTVTARGSPIGANQGVAIRCADLAVMVENARLLTYEAAWLKDSGRPFKQAAARRRRHGSRPWRPTW